MMAGVSDIGKQGSLTGSKAAEFLVFAIRQFSCEPVDARKACFRTWARPASLQGESVDVSRKLGVTLLEFEQVRLHLNS